MESLSRRTVLAAAAGTMATAAAQAATYGNPDEPPQGQINTLGNPSSFTDPGPQNPAIASQFPQAFSPPPTDVGDMPMFWASFNNAPRRIQNGGWARQVTQADFADLGGDFRRQHAAHPRRHPRAALAPGRASGPMSAAARCRITTIDSEGRSNVEDVQEGGLWYFPSGLPHSLQGIGDGRCEFILCFDDGKATEYNTLLLNSGSRTRRRRCWRSISACRPTPSRTSR